MKDGREGRRDRRSAIVDLMRESEHQDPWLISYADMMTLLAGLFVMMFTYASFDQAALRRISKALTGTFGMETVKRDAKQLAKSIQDAMAMTPYVRDMEMKPLENGLEVSFTTSTLFESGSAEMTPEAEKAIRALAGRVRNFGKEARIKVEGHTDDNPISSLRYPSNWVLSSARAATIVQLFEEMSYPPDRLETAGFGSSRPLLPNRDLASRPIPENRAKNRRVVIKIVLRGLEQS